MGKLFIKCLGVIIVFSISSCSNYSYSSQFIDSLEDTKTTVSNDSTSSSDDTEPNVEESSDYFSYEISEDLTSDYSDSSIDDSGYIDFPFI